MATQTTPAQQNPTILIKEITDQYVRKNFQNMSEYFSKQNQLLNFKFFEISTDAAVDSGTLAHGLGVLPKDIVVLFISGDGQITFDLDNSDLQNLAYSTSGAVYCRIMVGSYWGNQSSNAAPGKMIVGAPDAAAVNETKATIVSNKYQMVPTDRFLLVNGSTTFTIALPDPSGVANQFLTFYRTDNTYNVTSITGTGFTGTLASPREKIVVYCDGKTFTLIERIVNVKVFSQISFLNRTQGTGVPWPCNIGVDNYKNWTVAGVFTAPKSCWYEFKYWSVNQAGTGNTWLVFLNGVAAAGMTSFPQAGFGTCGSAILKMNKNDTAFFCPDGNINIFGGNATVTEWALNDAI